MFKYFLFLVIFAKSTLIYGFNEPRIQNGTITPSDLFQFAVQIRAEFWCTASIISNRHLLTAAHCIDEEKSKIVMHERYKVHYGIPYHAKLRPINESVANQSLLPTSTTAYLPKDYLKKYMLSFDIAILEFPEDTDFGIEPVKLAKDYIEKEGDEAYITGFGAWWMEGNNSSGGSDVLRHDKISMINDCFGTLEICGGNSNQHALPGDSGGPMLIQRNNQWYQIGVCSSHSNYDFRTRVSSYCNFIEEVTKNEVKCESIFLESQILPLKHFEPIYNGQETPLKLFDFVIPFYNCYFSDGCTATVISKRHLLTSADCVYQEWLINFCQITDYSSYKSIHCVFFPDFRSKNVATPLKYPERVFAYFPLNYKWPYYHNLAVIEFPEGTDFGVKPVTLAKDYVQTYLENETLIVAGFGKHERDQNIPPLLHHSNASYKLYEPGLKIYHFENITFTQDNGGPTLIERNGKFYQIFVNYFLGTPSGSRTSVSVHCDFIEEVTKNEVNCESVAPIYEKPLESTTPTFLSPFSEQFTLLPQNASRIVFQIKLFLFTIFTVFFL